MATSANRTDGGLSFGPFNLLVNERLLTRQGVPVELGARALDILIALTSAPNEVVSKKTLMSRVWPDVIVEEGSLRFHMNGLRKALGDGRGEARYITTLAGRGYCFVAPVSRPDDSGSRASAAKFAHANLPSPLTRIVGRDEEVRELSAKLTASRLVSIVGPGGIGKTTVAVAVGHHLSEAFGGAVLFVDFGMLSDPNLVAPGLASMLGLSVGSDNVGPNIIAFLRDKRVLLIFDTCEHLIEPVAMLARNIVEAAPEVRILTTTREALRIEGERVYKLDVLRCPPDDASLSAREVLSFPAARLFMERAEECGASLDIGDADARTVANICRKLDGVALAVELAARRVEACGLAQTAELLDQRLTLAWLGARTAPPRQRTLQATLDWSYGLLAEPERLALCRLSIFVGHFTLDAALEVIACPALNQARVLEAIDSLVAKSMVAVQPMGAMMRYRLLDTTRAYAHQFLAEGTERDELAARHAAYYRRWLKQFGAEWQGLQSGSERGPHFAALNNVRAALEWCFGTNGNGELGVGLAAAATPVFLAMSLIPECHRWSQRALVAMKDAAGGAREEMHLQAGLGISLMYMRGGRDAAHAALTRSLALSEECGDALDRMRILTHTNQHYLRIGAFKTALASARRCAAIAETVEDAAAKSLGRFLLGNSLHFNGDIDGARGELEAAWAGGTLTQNGGASYLGFEGKRLAGAILARNLWLQGHPIQAGALASQTVEDSLGSAHSLMRCFALLGGIAVCLWNGDLPRAETYIEQLISCAESHSLTPYVILGQGFMGEAAIRRGEAVRGAEVLRRCLEKLHSMNYEVFTSALEISLCQGLAALGLFDEGILLIDEAIERGETHGDLCYMAEALRIRAGLLLSKPGADADDADHCLVQSLALSRRQGARAWGLRSATDLAALWAGQGRNGDAHALLQPVYAQYSEGLDTPDLKAAGRLLRALQ